MNHGLSSKYISDEDIAWAIENGYWKALACALGLRGPSSPSDERSMKERLLHSLVRESTVEVVAKLLDSGIDVNAQEGGKTALHIANERGDTEMVALLLSRGASVQSGSPPESGCPLVTRGNCNEQQLSERGVKHIPHREASRDAISVYLTSAPLLREYGQPLSPIMRAIRAGREDIVDLYLETGDIDWSECVSYHTMFEHALLSGNTELVELALKSGADPNATTFHNRPMLYAAIKSSNPKIVETMIRAGARLDERDEFGNTMLSEAFWDLARNYDLFSARVLVELGADREQILHEAADVGADEIVHWLLTNGVDVNCQDDNGYTPLHNAVNQMTRSSEAFDTGAIELLLRHGADPTILTKEGQSVLASVCRSGSTSAVSVAKLLLEAGARPDEGCVPPLTEAAISGNAELIHVLLDSGANIRVTDSYGDTPWLVVRQLGQMEIADLLEGLGGAVEPAGVEDDLHRAIRWNKTDAAIRLIRNGADIERVDSDGMTPLMVTIQHWQNTAIVQELLRYGADVRKRTDPSINWQDWSALELAAAANCAEIVAVLLQHGADVNGAGGYDSPLIAAIPCGDTEDDPVNREKLCECVKALLNGGADPDVIENGEGMSPLHRAVYLDCLPLVELLLKHGADINVPSRSDNGTAATPLLEAVWRHRPEIALYLIKHGADVNVPAVRGTTPLMAACRYSPPDRFEPTYEVVKSLIAAGADINARNSDGETVLAMTRNEELRAALIAQGAVEDASE